MSEKTPADVRIYWRNARNERQHCQADRQYARFLYEQCGLAHSVTFFRVEMREAVQLYAQLRPGLAAWAKREGYHVSWPLTGTHVEQFYDGMRGVR